MKTLSLLLIAVTATFAQWNFGGGGGGKTLNDYKKVSVSGRDVHVYAPSGLADNSPLLLSLHGMDQDPNFQQENTHWEAVADTAGFVVAYPRGGTGYSTWDISGDQDTKWITEIIDQLAKDYKIDTKRVYLSGFSMGGMFSYHAMSKIADKIAAFAPCSGYLMMGAGTAMRPVPIFHSHGTNDGVVGYDGLENNLGNYRKQFNCPSQAEVQENYPHEGGSATLYTWGPCDNGIYVKHLKLFNRDHNPAKTEVSDIWNFVKEYDVNGPITAGSKQEEGSATTDTTKKDDELPQPGADKADSSKTDVAAPDTSKADVAKPDSSKADSTGSVTGQPGTIASVTDSSATKDPIMGFVHAPLMLTTEKTFAVYNMKGAFVCNLKATGMSDVQAQLNSKRFDKGLYVVKNGNFNRIFSVK